MIISHTDPLISLRPPSQNLGPRPFRAPRIDAYVYSRVVGILNSSSFSSSSCAHLLHSVVSSFQDPRYKEDFYRKSWRNSDGSEVLMERIWCPRSLLCMPIHNPDGDIVAIAQVANKIADGDRPDLEMANGKEELENGDVEGGTQFTDDDEKVR